MIKKILLISMFFCLSAKAQDQNNDRKLMLFSYDNKTWGYADDNLWNNFDEWHEIIPPRFEEAAEFVDGLAKVKEHGLYGYIDKTGNYVIEPSFYEATDFKNGIALVKVSGEYISIDTAGKKVSMPLDAKEPAVSPFIRIPIQSYTYNVIDHIDTSNPLSKRDGLSLLRIRISR